MVKLFAGAALVAAIEASFVGGMLMMMYLEGIVPETAHKAIDEVSDVIRGREA